MTQEACWKVIHIARSERSVRELLSFLEKEGFLVRFRRIASGVAGKECFEILVPFGEAEDAQQLLIENNLLR